MASPNLGITPLTANQSGKETTINNADLALEYATQRTLAVDMSAGDVTLTNTQYTRYFVFKCSGQTANRNLVVPLQLTTGNAAQRFFAVINLDATYDIVVKGATGATVTIPASSAAYLCSDGVDVTSIIAGTSGPPVTTLDGLTDVDTTTTPPTSGQFFVYDGTHWVPNTPTYPFDIPGYCRDQVPDAFEYVKFPAARAFTIPASLAGTQCIVGVNPTSSATITLKKNGTGFGTITISTGGTITLTAASQTSFAAGDIFEAVGSSPADATLAEVAFVIVGSR
jgi:hypothetical protein